jgi:hypothetical protein
VDSIASAIDYICQIGQVYQVGAINEILRVVQRLEESREKIVEIRYVVLGDVKDNDELCGMLDQKLAERFDDLSTSSTQKIASSRITPNGGVQDLELSADKTTAHSAGDSAFSLDDLEAFRQFAFPDLHAQNQYLAQKKENVEQRSDMVEGRRKRNNILKLDAVISWLESDHSELLWIDGNNILDHNMWNATFAFPILVDATSNYELAVILRYFCGELGTSTKVNSVSTLLQAFIYQTLQQHLSAFKARPELLTRERLVNARNNFDTLWSLFRDCLETCGASYILITIDSVDRLQTETMPDSEARSSFNIEQLIDALNMLAQDRKKLVKILLTARLASKAAESSSAAEQALTLRRPHRRLSVDVILQERPLFLAKMREIAEGKCKHILFEEAWMLYPPRTVIYASEQGHITAYVVSELSGMELGEPKGSGRRAPLRLRCWSIDHDGTQLVKRFHDFSIAQFAGTRLVSSLRYVPTTCHPSDAQRRPRLIKRGRKYWSCSMSPHHLLHKGQIRVMVDQQRSPFNEQLKDHGIDSQDWETRLDMSATPKPLALLVCPANNWSLFSTAKRMGYVSHLAPAIG